MGEIKQTFSHSKDLRLACRSGEFTGQTSAAIEGFTQANLVILPEDWANDFLLFAQRNPKPCPLLAVTNPGEFTPKTLAENSDLRTDLPRYRIWKQGELIAEPTEISDHWQDDFVSFLIGCSFTFESAMLRAGIPVRHIELGVNVPMYLTNLQCEPAGRFRGPQVVSMRPMTPSQAIHAVQITSRFPSVHGAPIHLGLPAQIGIVDLGTPDFGDPVPMKENEIPVFWACGVTPQAVIQKSKPPLVVTHSPGSMFVTDLKDDELTVG